MAGPPNPAQGGASLSDISTQLTGINRLLSALVQAYKGRISFGSFTLAAAATTAIPNVAVLGNSNISLTPMNASAAALVAGAHSPYISLLSPGVGFTVATADGGNAAGTEIFNYIINTPS